MSPDRAIGQFVWDFKKERVNIERHGLNFKHAIQAFRDPHRLIAKDSQHSQQEERLFCIGKIGLRVATVRFPYRGEKIRIMGVGYWRNGRKLYEAEF